MMTILRGAAAIAAQAAAEKNLDIAVAECESAQRRLNAILAAGGDTTAARAALTQAIQRRRDCHQGIADIQQVVEKKHLDKIILAAEAINAEAVAGINRILENYQFDLQETAQ